MVRFSILSFRSVLSPPCVRGFARAILLTLAFLILPRLDVAAGNGFWSKDLGLDGCFGAQFVVEGLSGNNPRDRCRSRPSETAWPIVSELERTLAEMKLVAASQAECTQKLQDTTAKIVQGLGTFSAGLAGVKQE